MASPTRSSSEPPFSHTLCDFVRDNQHAESYETLTPQTERSDHSEGFPEADVSDRKESAGPKGHTHDDSGQGCIAPHQFSSVTFSQDHDCFTTFPSTSDAAQKFESLGVPSTRVSKGNGDLSWMKTTSTFHSCLNSDNVFAPSNQKNTLEQLRFADRDPQQVSTPSSVTTPFKPDPLSFRMKISPQDQSTPLKSHNLSTLSTNTMMSPDSDIVEDSRIYQAELRSPSAPCHSSTHDQVFPPRERDMEVEHSHEQSQPPSCLPSFSLWEHLKYEINPEEEEQAPEPLNSTHLRSERISNFFNVPTSIEAMITFGVFICLDAFLSVFTILPIKFVVSFWKMIISLARRIVYECPRLGKSENPNSKCRAPNRLGVANKVDLIQGLLIILACLILHHVTDASRMYHSVRGQETIKLYVIFNVVEIADRLCCSFGQDLLDSLFSPSTLGRRRDGSQPRIKPMSLFIMALIFTVAHTLVLFYQLVSLNVAINSYDQSLMTLLISSQFVEIKGSVFKKFEKENLFQMSCADIVERFQLFSMLAIIALRNMIELSGSSTSSSSSPSHAYSYTYQYLPAAFCIFPSLSLIQSIFLPALIVIASEIVVDWLKHAFITKFNHIRPSVYGRFIDVLCKDLVAEDLEDSALCEGHSKLKPFLDRSPAVARRLGFSVFPMCCLTVRVFFQAMDMVSDVSHLEESLQCTMDETSASESPSRDYRHPAPLKSLLYLKKLITGSKFTSGSESAPLLLNSQLANRLPLYPQPPSALSSLSSSSFSNIQLHLLFGMSLVIFMIFLILFKLYLGIYLRCYGLNRMKTIGHRKNEDLLNGKNRLPIGSSQNELLKKKEERQLIESEEFDVPHLMAQQSDAAKGSRGFKDLDGTQDPRLRKRSGSRNNRSSHEHQPHANEGSSQRQKISMDQLSRFDMVRSRIW